MAVSIQRPPFCMTCILSYIFPKKHLVVTRKSRIFAEEKLHSEN